ncbi:MAG TPA: polysaccharide deacetylase family protein [Xanthobacteraceae bacterium]|nr:polysaccharide deacetylase family protein [Xanthobacteraceae bacterium]
MIGRSILVAAILLPGFAAAAPCPGNPDALGTARILAVDPATTPRVGRKQFAATLPLAPKEVVLTFDDGPWPGPTNKVLDALRHECVRATFFLLGRNAAAHPALARRELAEGHTLAHHTYSHPLLGRVSMAAAEREIDRGIAADERATYGSSGQAVDAAADTQPTQSSPPKTPFFRFPGFAASPALLNRMAARKFTVFGADLWASDWNPMSPGRQLRLVLSRLDAAGRGIVLFHDTKQQTAAMMPAFLRALKARGYRVVHVVPAGAADGP